MSLPRPRKSETAFSLVEVVLALAVVSFCLTAVLGILSVGFLSMNNASDQAGAGIVLGQIAEDIRSASTNQNGNYDALGICSNLSWSIGGTAPPPGNYSLSVGGDTNVSTTDPASHVEPRLVAHVEVTPPPTAFTPGSAIVSVAWPEEATWNAGNWTKAQGSVSTYVVFWPRP